ncbi:MAG: DUF4248 domain-containing protein [Parabacteroides sp.]|nr:DUF4248 domain-containing protein [Parabacteroides sp.]
METTFKIRAYGRMELAEVYLPGRLLSLGYHEGERVYSPAMVRAIIESLGEP